MNVLFLFLFFWVFFLTKLMLLYNTAANNCINVIIALASFSNNFDRRHTGIFFHTFVVKSWHDSLGHGHMQHYQMPFLDLYLMISTEGQTHQPQKLETLHWFATLYPSPVTTNDILWLTLSLIILMARHGGRNQYLIGIGHSTLPWRIVHRAGIHQSI